jgi:hypothetical protein
MYDAYVTTIEIFGKNFEEGRRSVTLTLYTTVPV